MNEQVKKTIDIDEKELRKLIKLRNKAIKEGDTQFLYNNHPMLVEYAYYSILYVAHEFGFKVIQPHSATEIPSEVEITKLVKNK